MKTLAQLLLVNTMTPSNTGVFSEYVMPNISPLTTDPDLLVRCTYAQCLSPLAEIGSRLLDLSRGMLSDADQQFSSSTSKSAAQAAKDAAEETSYDAALANLQATIRDQAVVLLVDTSSHVKRSLLRGLAPLCVFLGRAQTADVLLSHSITYLNDPDWALRSAFFEACVGLAACVGGKSVEQYILPLMAQALTGAFVRPLSLRAVASGEILRRPTDVEEAVVARVLASLTTLVEIGLVQKSGFWEVYEVAAGLLCHPSAWIRRGASIPSLYSVTSRNIPLAQLLLRSSLPLQTASSLLPTFGVRSTLRYDDCWPPTSLS